MVIFVLYDFVFVGLQDLKGVVLIMVGSEVVGELMFVWVSKFQVC